MIKPSKKGLGFVPPLRPHEHWHVDVSYFNLCGTFYYLCSVLDGYSRYVVHWDIQESMTEGRGGADLAAGQGEVSGGQAADHFG